MSLSYGHLSYIVLICLIVFAALLFIVEKRLFQTIEDLWFYKRTNKNKISTIFFVLGISILAISLLDLRGPQEQIQTTVPVQKTVILLDASVSMLAEDVKPNRFKRSVTIIRHLIRKSIGHEFSVMLFSDITKQLIPFTSDLELLESRVSSLSNKQITDGGTNLKKAIQETINYFKTSNNKNLTFGNIVIFSDSEDTYESFKLDIPKNISIAFVGVGTVKGTTIIKRDHKGNSFGYVKYKGEKVVSRLNEAFLKRLKGKVKNFKYWIASSYSLPTEEIISFFNSIHSNRYKEQVVKIKPVMMHYLVIPGIFLLCVSFLLGNARTFLLLALVFVAGHSTFAQTPSERYHQRLKNGNLSKREKLEYASILATEKKFKKAEILFDESIGKISDVNKDNMNILFNYATTLFENKKTAEGITVLEELLNFLDTQKDQEQYKTLREIIKKNIKKALKERKNKKNKEKKQKKNNKKNKDKKQGDEKKNNTNNSKQDKTKKKQMTNKLRAKIPALIKQLMDKDRKLQEARLNTSTSSKIKKKDARNW